MTQATPSPPLSRRRLGKTNLDIPVIPFGTRLLALAMTASAIGRKYRPS